MSEDLQTMVRDCQQRQRLLTDWESEFMGSVHARMLSGNALTQRQAETLGEIWDRVTEEG